DGRFEVPTLQEVIDLVANESHRRHRPIGIYPETKHPTYFDSIGLSLEEPLVDTLDANGYVDESDDVFVQSFEVGNLEQLDTLTDVRLVQLAGCSGAPADDPRPYSQILSRRGLAEVATYADGIGPCKDLVIPRNADGTLGEPTELTRRAHRAGLLVHAYTFRAENIFLPTDYRSGPDPTAHGDLAGEIRAFLRAGLDGLFSDHPDIAAKQVRR
ncbi:MAG TPA: glycerophosphodiester phosphodiesterase family protein, partial [Candidatus Nanopelagicales bacterium]|nr:glycerophosphodiester phosphodiesterase family protein [Candidatus Nanopelagicales bacterium]